MPIGPRRSVRRTAKAGVATKKSYQIPDSDDDASSFGGIGASSVKSTPSKAKAMARKVGGVLASLSMNNNNRSSSEKGNRGVKQGKAKATAKQTKPSSNPSGGMKQKNVNKQSSDSLRLAKATQKAATAAVATSKPSNNNVPSRTQEKENAAKSRRTSMDTATMASPSLPKSVLICTDADRHSNILMSPPTEARPAFATPSQLDSAASPMHHDDNISAMSSSVFSPHPTYQRSANRQSLANVMETSADKLQRTSRHLQYDRDTKAALADDVDDDDDATLSMGTPMKKLPDRSGIPKENLAMDDDATFENADDGDAALETTDEGTVRSNMKKTILDDGDDDEDEASASTQENEFEDFDEDEFSEPDDDKDDMYNPDEDDDSFIVDDDDELEFDAVDSPIKIQTRRGRAASKNTKSAAPKAATDATVDDLSVNMSALNVNDEAAPAAVAATTANTTNTNEAEDDNATLQIDADETVVVVDDDATIALPTDDTVDMAQVASTTPESKQHPADASGMFTPEAVAVVVDDDDDGTYGDDDEEDEAEALVATMRTPAPHARRMQTKPSPNNATVDSMAYSTDKSDVEDDHPIHDDADDDDETVSYAGGVSKLLKKFESHGAGTPDTAASNTQLASSKASKNASSQAKSIKSPMSATKYSTIDSPLPTADATLKKAQSPAQSKVTTAANANGKGKQRKYHRSEGNIKPGKWSLGTKIGVGSFGVVHVGMNMATGTLMAVKSFKMSTSVMKDVRSEVELMRSLNHHNIVQYYGAEIERNVLHIFQEWVPAGSVAEMLSKFGAFSMSVIRSYLKQTLTGLAFLHSNSILHRDIKGSNLLVTNEGIVKLADFGASKRVGDFQDDLMMSMTARGTPYFMAPEVFEEKYSSKADIWSVGCVAYQMVTGSPPWKDKGFTNPITLFNYLKKRCGPPAMKLEGRSNITSDEKASTGLFQALVGKCYHKHPSTRPTAKALLGDAFFIEMHHDEDDASNTPCKALFSPGASTVASRSPIGYHQLPPTSPSPIKLTRSKSVVDQRASFISPPRPRKIVAGIGSAGASPSPIRSTSKPRSKASPVSTKTKERLSYASEKLQTLQYGSSSPSRKQPSTTTTTNNNNNGTRSTLVSSPGADSKKWPIWARDKLKSINSQQLTPDSKRELSKLMDSLALSPDSSSTNQKSSSYNPYGSRRGSSTSNLKGLDFLNGSTKIEI